MGKDHEEWTRNAERRRTEIAASIATLDKKWVQRFEADVKADTRFERSLLLRAWGLALFILLLTLIRRLYL